MRVYNIKGRDRDLIVDIEARGLYIYIYIRSGPPTRYPIAIHNPARLARARVYKKKGENRDYLSRSAGTLPPHYRTE